MPRLIRWVPAMAGRLGRRGVPAAHGPDGGGLGAARRRTHPVYMCEARHPGEECPAGGRALSLLMRRLLHPKGYSVSLPRYFSLLLLNFSRHSFLSK